MDGLTALIRQLEQVKAQARMLVRLDIVWEVVQHDLPSMIETLKPLIPPEDSFS